MHTAIGSYQPFPRPDNRVFDAYLPWIKAATDSASAGPFPENKSGYILTFESLKKADIY